MPIDVQKETKKIRDRAVAEAIKIGAEMAALRKAKRFKQGLVAAEMGIHQPVLCDLEKGKRFWTETDIYHFKKAIGEDNNKKDNYAKVPKRHYRSGRQ